MRTAEQMKARAHQSQLSTQLAASAKFIPEVEAHTISTTTSENLAPTTGEQMGCSEGVLFPTQ